MNCPFCKAELKPTAVKCKFCNEMLPGGRTREGEALPEQSAGPRESDDQTSSSTSLDRQEPASPIRQAGQATQPISKALAGLFVVALLSIPLFIFWLISAVPRVPKELPMCYGCATRHNPDDVATHERALQQQADRVRQDKIKYFGSVEKADTTTWRCGSCGQDLTTYTHVCNHCPKCGTQTEDWTKPESHDCEQLQKINRLEGFKDGYYGRH